MAWAWLLLAGCLEAVAVDPWDSEGDEDAELVVFGSGATAELWAGDRNQPLELAPRTVLVTGQAIAVARYDRGLAELGLGPGLLPVRPCIHTVGESFGGLQVAPRQRLWGALNKDGLQLQPVVAFPDDVEQLCIDTEDQGCRGYEQVTKADRDLTGIAGATNTGGTIVALARLDDERALLVSKNGRFIESRFGSDAEAAELLIRTSTQPIASGWQDPSGVLWLVTPSLGLLKADPPDAPPTWILPEVSTTTLGLTSLHGGWVDGQIQLVGYAPEDSAILVYDQGAARWTPHPGAPPCAENCEGWRTRWLGPDDFMLTGRRFWLHRVQNGRVTFLEDGTRECSAHSLVERDATGDLLVACQDGGSFIVVTDDQLKVRRQTEALGAWPVFAFAPHEKGVVLIGGDTRLALWRRDAERCLPLRAGAADVSLVLPIGKSFVSVSFARTAQGDRTIEPRVMWFQFAGDVGD